MSALRAVLSSRDLSVGPTDKSLEKRKILMSALQTILLIENKSHDEREQIVRTAFAIMLHCHQFSTNSLYLIKNEHLSFF